MKSTRDNSVAIIGMACHLPGADTPEELWRQLIRQAPDNDDAAPSHALKTIAAFDPGFFGISERDAVLMDPQHRHFLMCASEAIENAGSETFGSGADIGVFAGCGYSSYALDTSENSGTARVNGFPETATELQMLLGTAGAFLSARVSHALNLTGPSVNVQAACATGLVAVHLACRSLLAGECSMALAGAAALRLSVNRSSRPQAGMILARDGITRPFDRSSDGTVYGDGAGAVLLKPLSDALRDGDPVHAIIRGSAVTNDGASALGFAAPSIEGQSEAIRRALKASGCAPDTIGYIETHGTGTRLGDPIEVVALAENYGTGTRTGPCDLGAAKATFGHSAEAAGMTGLIAAALALKRRTVPGLRHFTEPNPAMNLDAGPFRLNSASRPWTLPGVPRAGVSAFGMGGNNCHMILEAPADPPSEEQSGLAASLPVLLSARSAEGLRRMARRLRIALAQDRALQPSDIAFTMAATRRMNRFRRVFSEPRRSDLSSALKKVENTLLHVAPPTAPPGLAFLFPETFDPEDEGLRTIRSSHRSFRDTLERVDALLVEMPGAEKPFLNARPQQRLSGGLGSDSIATFAISLALTELWTSWGVRPDRIVPVGPGKDIGSVLEGQCRIEDVLIALLRNRDADQVLVRRAAGGGSSGPSVLDTPAYGGCAASPRDEMGDLRQEGIGVVLDFRPDIGRSDPWRATGSGQALHVLACLGAPSSALCHLFERGVDIDWTAWFGADAGRKCHLPPTPFELEDHWPAPHANAGAAPAAPLSPGARAVCLNAAARDHIRAAFADLGVLGDHHRVERSRLRDVVAARHLPWAERLADIHEQQDTGPGPSPGSGRTGLILVERVGARLAGILRGNEDGREALFPGGRDTLLARFYRSDPSLRASNRAAADIVAELVRTSSGPLRVLEIGAGTLATTLSVLGGTPAGSLDYTVTDIGQSFVARARQRLRGRAEVSVSRLDIEQPAAAQGFAEGAYDVVIAANVLHAAGNVRQALDHAAALVRPGGRLILIEGIAARPWIDMVFGALPGWWRFQDHDLRPGHPLLATDDWTRLAARAGLTLQETRTSSDLVGADAVPQALMSFGKTGITADLTGSKVRPVAGTGSLAVVTRLCARLTGVNTQQFAADRTFEDQGLDSLALLELRAALEKQMSGAVPEIFGDDTPARLAGRLFTVSPLSPTPGACRLVRLCGVSGGEPVIAMPSVLETTTGLKDLAARLAGAGAVFGIDLDPGLEAAIAVRAAAIAAELCAVFPQGRVTLVGHSYGGLLAHATAQALQNSGTAVNLLAILDIPASPAFGSGFPAFGSLDTAGAVLPAQGPGSGRPGRLSRDLATRYAANLAALADFRPAPVSADEVVLIRARTRLAEHDFLPDREQSRSDPSWGWQRFSDNKVSTVIVPGNHMTMLDSPNVDILADNLLIRLNR
ncbi:beta-ketoacyl synthase N-terminal-like domain-containing protein [Roseibium sp. AS2]|uniref:beta-ketoacyl synthase N-terminal-like domain-containing protein n=1 Tax=Roseibium sp. AS2 TaxID=3135781 RepID=UPI003172BC4A